jgi:hypothetical protein
MLFLMCVYVMSFYITRENRNMAERRDEDEGRTGQIKGRNGEKLRYERKFSSVFKFDNLFTVAILKLVVTSAN